MSRRAARGLFALAAVLALTAGGRDAFDGWIDATALPPLIPEVGVEVLDRSGALLRAYTVADGRWRLAVGTAEVDPGYLRMLIAYEDKRFYSHHGVDPVALTRAAWQAVRHGGVVSGGSTLTMQVARLLEDSGTGRMAGKLRQMRVALALERRLDKARILGLYLHLAPYGGNVEGIRAATLAWLGKEPRRLTAAEAALLIALPQSPEARRPDRAPQAARTARDRVLERMAGAGVLSPDRAAAAMREPSPDRRLPFPTLAPHMADRMRAAAPLRAEHRLTLDAGLQRALETIAARIARTGGERLSVAIVVADHGTGDILASVGGADFGAETRQGYVDMTRAPRSPGSTLKPLVYGLAFDAGLAHPETLIDDRPTRFGDYAPQNFDRTFHGTLRVREALQMSLNIPVVALTDAIGPARLLAALKRAGVEPAIPGGQPGLAVALGGVGVTLEDLVQLYAAIARGGVPVSLHATAGMTEAKRLRLLSAEAAWQVADILSGVAPPPGSPANRLPYKTGTSYGHRDAWAVGFDGRHVAGVWLGRADGTPVPGAFGGDLAAPVLFEVFARLKPALDPLPPPPPGTLLLSTPQLPQPLQRFRSRAAAFAPAPDAPVLAFPPDGAVVERIAGGLAVKVRNGTPPFVWLADGVPVAAAGRDRDTRLPVEGPGFVRLTVIDALGRSASATVMLR